MCAPSCFRLICLSKCVFACLIELCDGYRVKCRCLGAVKQEKEEDWFWALNNTLSSPPAESSRQICPTRHSTHPLSYTTTDCLCVPPQAASWSYTNKRNVGQSKWLPAHSFSTKLARAIWLIICADKWQQSLLKVAHLSSYRLKQQWKILHLSFPFVWESGSLCLLVAFCLTSFVRVCVKIHMWQATHTGTHTHILIWWTWRDGDSKRT